MHSDDDSDDRRPTPRQLRIGEEEAKALDRKAIRCHAQDCIQPGGHLWQLAQLTDTRFRQLYQLRWLELLATPAAIIVSTLLILLYFHLHPR